MNSVIEAPASAVLSRKDVCPSLLRTFVRNGGHHSPPQFEPGKEPVDDEVLLHTWPDATLREITTLLKQVNDEARRKEARLQFAFVYPDKRGVMVLRPVGKVASSRKGDDDEKQLRALGWQPGDVLDIAIFVREEGRPSLKRF